MSCRLSTSPTIPLSLISTADIEDRLASLSPTALRNEPSTRESAALDAAALLESITERLSSYTGIAA